MRFLVHLTLLLICNYASGKSVTVPNCGKSLVAQERIVGGKNALHGNYPFMVSLYYHKMGHVCGGSVINENLIVTNAHCFLYSEDVKDYTVYAGIHKLSEKNHWAAQEVNLSAIVIHPGYENQTYTNDIALLRPIKPIDIAGSKGYVNGICLPEDTTKDPTGKVTVIGWGHTKENGTVSDILNEVDLEIMDRTECDKIYVKFIVDTMEEETEEDKPEHFLTQSSICATASNKDSCRFDSGGPLFKFNEQGAAVLYGSVSLGLICGEYPGVYTNIRMYKDWIEDNA